MFELTRRRIAGAAAVALVGAAAGWALWQRAPADGGLMAGNGRLEAVQVDVAARVPGRVAELLVDEGQDVRAGQPLLRLDAAPLRLQYEAAQAQLARERDAIVTATALASLRRQEAAAATAAIAQRQADRDAAAQRLERSRALLPIGGVSAQQLDDDQARLSAAGAALDAARAQLQAARAAVAAADSQRVEAGSVVRAAEAQLRRIALDIDDCTVRAATAGRIDYVIARPGEVMAAGAPLMGMVDLSRLDFVFFLPEQDAGRVAIGDTARLVLDALPGRPVDARVSYVSAVAQFTPKTVETANERQKLMFRVKARIAPQTAAAVPALKSGMPGMAYLRGSRDAPWPAHLPAAGVP